MTPAQLAEAGPWAVLVAVLIAGIGGLWTAFLRGWIVTGREFRRSEQRGRRTETQVIRNTRALETSAKAQAATAEALERLDGRLVSIERHLAALSAHDDPAGFHD